ncbi:thymidine phosphorylase [Pseudoruegeria sp. SK021]|uniref:thymidine phosphorylase n=1 Tax=Pseudoruegeria sp. SK021 TaxID=1933035 RepID=UPI000A221388|nr:thymidine phosphorylase [Pseudoruegeria sp. SK021]OSP53878.1 thymidine phosphorylase [Pseudoruegeria sp. SK021]
MDARTVLAHLREGIPLTEAQLHWFARGLATGEVSHVQGAAFAMGVCKGGMSAAEIVALTRAMRDSGDVLHWDLPGPVVDKHSTGGLGDATSLIVAPIAAALGAFVPMLSGRGLGHTGGTLDKLEAIPGVCTDVDEARLRAIVGQVGCAIVGATTEIAPADRILYSLRDQTSTVESRALITASILSKKLASGAQALVLDVKGGSGAFMKTRAEASALAESLVSTAKAAGCATRALITDMNQPLARSIGNAVEIAAVVQVLRDPRPESRLCRLSLALVGEMLALAGLYPTAAAGGRAALDVLQSGAAAERFAAMVHALGGPSDVVSDPERYLPSAPVICDVPALSAGHISGIDGEALGQVVLELGGGRLRPEDVPDPRVGLTDVLALGDAVVTTQPLARLHAADAASAERAIPVVQAAFQIGAATKPPPLIHGRVG